MASKVFAIVLLKPNEEVQKRIVEECPGAFEYNNTFFLVKVPDTVLSADLAQQVGIRGDDRIDGASGFVIQQRGAYSGYTRRDLWEWFSAVEEGNDE